MVPPKNQGVLVSSKGVSVGFQFHLKDDFSHMQAEELTTTAPTNKELL
jgi:hypothetical protein